MPSPVSRRHVVDDVAAFLAEIPVKSELVNPTRPARKTAVYIRRSTPHQNCDQSGKRATAVPASVAHQ